MLVGPYANGKTMIAERFVLQHLGSAGERKGLDRADTGGNGAGAFLCERDRGIWRAGERASLGLAVGRTGRRVASSTAAPHPDLRRIPQCVARPRRATSRRFSHSSGVSAREYDVSPVLIGEVAVYDHVNATPEMASRFQTAARSALAVRRALSRVARHVGGGFAARASLGLVARALARRVFSPCPRA